jgi:hypothetical protein
MTQGIDVVQGLAHPFVILIIGGIITYMIAPQLIRFWQANEKLTELKYNITEQITEAVSKMLIGIQEYNDKSVIEAKDVDTSSDTQVKGQDLGKGRSEWEKSSQQISIKIHLYLRKNNIENEWKKFGKQLVKYSEDIEKKTEEVQKTNSDTTVDISEKRTHKLNELKEQYNKLKAEEEEPIMSTYMEFLQYILNLKQETRINTIIKNTQRYAACIIEYCKRK